MGINQRMVGWAKAERGARLARHRVFGSSYGTAPGFVDSST